MFHSFKMLWCQIWLELPKAGDYIGHIRACTKYGIYQGANNAPVLVKKCRIAVVKVLIILFEYNASWKWSKHRIAFIVLETLENTININFLVKICMTTLFIPGDIDAKVVFKLIHIY